MIVFHYSSTTAKQQWNGILEPVDIKRHLFQFKYHNAITLHYVTFYKAKSALLSAWDKV